MKKQPSNFWKNIEKEIEDYLQLKFNSILTRGFKWDKRDIQEVKNFFRQKFEQREHDHENDNVR